jgi:PadR family transcriptional regulator
MDRKPAPNPRMTLPTQLVLRTLLEEPTRERYGLELGQAAGLPSGTIHPILARLERMGWLESAWGDADPHEQGRPRRRYYRLTPDGAERARNALARAYTSTTAISRLRPGPAGSAP